MKSNLIFLLSSSAVFAAKERTWQKGCYDENKQNDGRRHSECQQLELKQVADVRLRWAGFMMQVQSRADSLHSHGWAASLLLGDCLSDYLSGITQADVTITTGSRLPINNHLRYTQQPQSHPAVLVLHPLSHVIARASNMSLINARWLLISYFYKPVKAAICVRRSATYKLDTCLIYVG